jgi:hypothetical protein
MPSLVDPKIKYAVSDRPHWRQLDICETSFLLLNGSHWSLKFSLTYKLDLRKKKLFHNRLSSFCSRYPNMCDRTKKMDYSPLNCLQCNIYGHYRSFNLSPAWILQPFPAIMYVEGTRGMSLDFIVTLWCDQKFIVNNTARYIVVSHSTLGYHRHIEKSGNSSECNQCPVKLI